MIAILFFTILAIAALGWSIGGTMPRAARVALVVMAPFLFLIGMLIGTSVVIEPGFAGVVNAQLGQALPAGQVIARTGQQGAQADILTPGWHFGYIPMLHDVDQVPMLEIPSGKVGLVTAMDGAPLPKDEVFAAPWPSTKDMLTPSVFLERGQRGPQTTVLPPSSYFYNPKLHKIDIVDRTEVPAGSVAVITSMGGIEAGVEAGTRAMMVINGVPLVARGLRGVWSEPLLPGAYNLNTRMHKPTIVKTSQRVYVYQQAQARTHTSKAGSPVNDWSVTVRSKDGFEFPIDVRVVCAVEAKDAPYLVALLGNPDLVTKDDQEDEELEILEAKVVLPAVRAIFRNVAEGMNALEFVNARSQAEKIATERIRAELAKSRITCENVFLGHIHVGVSEPGRKLMTTQTDREVAVNEEKLYAEKKKAQESRAAFVKAEEEAEQQRNLVKASYEVQVKEQGAKARAAEAKGEADYQTITGEGRAKAYEAMVRTLGREQVAQLELLKLVAEGRIQITPQVMVTGGAGTMDALGGTLLRQAVAPPAPAGKP